jgi:predicted AAA+ superfamily ATPase
MHTDEATDALLRGLHDHNPWWECGQAAFDLPSRQKSDFYHLVRPGESGSQFEDQSLLALVGRRGSGKTTLLEQFVHHRIAGGADPEQFLYVPFDADPLYQLRSAEQLRRAVRYYESRVLGRAADPTPQFVVLDDVHRVEHPNKPNSPGWGDPVRDALDAPDRHVVVTASAGVQVERELDRVGVDGAVYDVQPVLPEKFRDYVYTLYPDIEADDRRVTPTPLRRGERSLPRALETGDPGPLVEGLRRQYDRLEAPRRVQSQVVDYLAMGGVLSYAQDGAVESARTLPSGAYRRLRDEVRNALYQDVPGFETIQTIADLERLCALAADGCGTEPVRYQRLVDLLDVDRRTVSDSYLPALSALYLLTGVTEYDNSRPRSVRLFLRDTGLVAALSDGDATRVLDDFDRETDVARVAAFDHTMRFAYGVDAARGVDADPSVRFWRGRNGAVDFVFEVDDTPVPVGFAYRPPVDGALEGVREFLDAYDAPLGLLLAGDTVSTERPIALRDDRVVQLPYWFYLLLC